MKIHIFSENYEIEVGCADLKRCEIEECDNVMACCTCGNAYDDFKRLQRLFHTCGVRRVVADAEIFMREGLGQQREQCEKMISTLDGAYAIALWKDDGEVCVFRDIFGLKPLYFAHYDGSFAFSSEREILTDVLKFPHAFEVDPRTMLIYRGGRLRFERISLIDALSPRASDEFEMYEEIADGRGSAHEERDDPKDSGVTAAEELKSELIHLLFDSVSRRIPDERFGILFSGGLDSTLIAFLCKQICDRHGLADAFTCYTAVFSPAAESAAKSAKEAPDLTYSREIADELGVRLVVTNVDIEGVESYLRKIVPLVGADVVNVGVALPLFVACERAVADGTRTLIYGIGAEELFGGYERHRRASERGILKEACISGVENMFRRDMRRDAAISRALRISLRAPFLTKRIAYFALARVPDEMKIRKEGEKVMDKAILRDIASDLGLRKAALRKKHAAQYGSNFLKAIDKLAKKMKLKKRAYLRQFHPRARMRLGCLFSGGKDSTLALHAMAESGYIVDCLITVRSKNPSAMMFHTPAIEMTELQASAMEIPLITHEISGDSEDDEIAGLRDALKYAMNAFNIDGIVAGALWSEYQCMRIVCICDDLGLKYFFPLWHIDQETEMRICVHTFDMIFTGVAALGLDKSWLGRRICDEDVDRLVSIHHKYKINIAGEGGEFETLVIDAPLFRKRIEILEHEIEEIDENTARLIVKRAEMRDKF